MSNLLHGTTHGSSAAAAAPTAAGVHSWSTSRDFRGPPMAAHTTPADVSAASGPMNGYGVNDNYLTGSHPHGTQFNPAEFSDFLGNNSSLVYDRGHQIQFGGHSSHMNQAPVPQGQFVSHGYRDFPPEAAAGDASMAAHHQHNYKSSYGQEHQWYAGSHPSSHELHRTSYPANLEELGPVASHYPSSVDATGHLEGPTESEELASRVQLDSMASREQHDGPALHPGAPYAASYRGPRADFVSHESCALEGLTPVAAAGRSSSHGQPGSVIDATWALPDGNAGNFFGSAPPTSAPEYRGTAGSASAGFLPLGAGSSTAGVFGTFDSDHTGEASASSEQRPVHSHPVWQTDTGSSGWLAAAAAAPDVSASGSQYSSVPAAPSLVNERGAALPEVASEPHRPTGDSDSSSGAALAHRDARAGHDHAQHSCAPELGLGGDTTHNADIGGSALSLAGGPKPDILGVQPFSSVHSPPDDSVQPDILADPCFHQPRPHGEQSREQSGGSQSGAALTVRSLVPDASVLGSSEPLHPTQHSVAIGYEPISPHSQSAFKAVSGAQGRRSSGSKTEGAAAAASRSSPAPLWQNDVPLHPAVYLQPIASSARSQSETAHTEATLERAAAAGTAMGRGSSGHGAAAAAVGVLGGVPSELSAAAAHRGHDSEPITSSANFEAPRGIRGMPMVNEDPAVAVHTVVPHPVPVPVFLQPPHEAGLAASSFSPSSLGVGTGVLLPPSPGSKTAAETAARRPSADAVANSVGQAPQRSAAAGIAPAAQQLLRPGAPAQPALAAADSSPLQPARGMPLFHTAGGSGQAAADALMAAAAPRCSDAQSHVGPQVASSAQVANQPLHHQLHGGTARAGGSVSAKPDDENAVTLATAQQLPRPTAYGLGSPVPSHREQQALQLPQQTLTSTGHGHLERAAAQPPTESLDAAPQITDHSSLPHFSAVDTKEGLRSGRAVPASYVSEEYAAAGTSFDYSAGGQQQVPGGTREAGSALANRMATYSMSRDTLLAPPHDDPHLSSTLLRPSAPSAPQTAALLPEQGYATSQATQGSGPQASAAPPVVGGVGLQLGAAAAVSGRQFTHGSLLAFNQDSGPVPPPQNVSQPSAPIFGQPPSERGAYPTIQDYGKQPVQGSHLVGGQGYAHPLMQESGQPQPHGYRDRALPGQGGGLPPAPELGSQAARVVGSSEAAPSLRPLAGAGNAPSQSYYGGTQSAQNPAATPWQQQHMSMPSAQGYGQHGGAQPAQVYGAPGHAAQYQPYDRRTPSVPPSPYQDYYAQYYGGGAGYGHYAGQDPYGGYQNRGYAYDRQSHPFYEPPRGAYSRGYLDELNTYAQQQAAAAAAYGSLYDYFQQYQQYYNAVQDSQLQLAHSRSSSRAVTPGVPGRDERSSYADNLSGYSSRPASVASVGIYSTGAAASLAAQHDVLTDTYGGSAGNSSALDGTTAAVTADYSDYSYAAGSHDTTDNVTLPSVEVPSRKTPACFPLPHSRVCFSKCGQLIVVLPNNPVEGQPALVQLHDLKHFLDQSGTGDTEPKTSLAEHANLSFPLIRGQTHKKDVIEFCDRQADKCRNSMGIHDRESSELMWRFLALLVKQNGTYVGSDIAELLLAGQDNVLDGYKRHSQVQETAAAWSQKSVDTFTSRFRELLLYGHVKEALDYAAKNELWGHALCLASKMDDRTLASVIARFTTSSMRSNDPLQTLYQLMSSKPPSVVTSIADDKWGSWRPHLAMMLVNAGNSALIHQSVVQLGDTLAAKGQLVASQFCYIMADLSFESYTRKSAKLSLLGAHSRMPEKEFLSNAYVEWTEVYEYAQSLGNPVFIMPSLQTYKLVKAWNHFEHGRLCEALRYCEVIGEKVVTQPSLFPTEVVKQLVELSMALKHQNAEAAQHLGTSGFVDASCSLPWLDQLTAVLESHSAGTYDTNLLPPVVDSAHGTNSGPLPANAVAHSVVAAANGPSGSMPPQQGHDQISGSQPYPASGAAADVGSAATTNLYQHDTFVDHNGAPADIGNPGVGQWTPYHHQGAGLGLPEQPSTTGALRLPPQQPANPPQWAPSVDGRGLPPRYLENDGAYAQESPHGPWTQRPASEPPEEALSTASDDTGESMDEDYARHNYAQPNEQPRPAEDRSGAEAHPKTDSSSGNKEPSKSLFSRTVGYIFKKKPQKAPKAAEMKLPDDKAKTIVWDSARGRWVDTAGGAEEEKVVGPPPQMGAPTASIASKGATSAAQLPPGTSPYSMARGRRLPTYVDPFKGTPSVASSPVPSLLSETLSNNRPLNVLMPQTFVPASQTNTAAATSSEPLQISRNESSASLEVQTIMSSSVQEAGQPATSQPMVPTGPSFYDPSQFSHSMPASTTKQRLNRRV